MQQVEICSSMRTVLNLVAATNSLKHWFVIPFIDYYFERQFTNYIIQHNEMRPVHDNYDNIISKYGLFLYCTT